MFLKKIGLIGLLLIIPLPIQAQPCSSRELAILFIMQTCMSSWAIGLHLAMRAKHNPALRRFWAINTIHGCLGRDQEMIASALAAVFISLWATSTMYGCFEDNI